MPAVGNLAAVLLVFMFVFAIIGMNLFGNMGPDNNGLPALNRHAHFNTFPTTMLVLFRCVEARVATRSWRMYGCDVWLFLCASVNVCVNVRACACVHVGVFCHLDAGPTQPLKRSVPGRDAV